MDLFSAAARTTSPSQALATCQEIQHPDTREWCVADTARMCPEDFRAQMETACAELETQPWRGECFFYLAEGLGRDGQYEQAAQQCSRTGPYRSGCLMHLFASLARDLTGAGQDGAALNMGTSQGAWEGGETIPQDKPSLLESSIQEATSAYRERFHLADLAGLPLDDRLARRIWTQFFQVAMEDLDLLSMETCDGLPRDQHARCRTALRILLRQRVAASLRSLAEPTSRGGKHRKGPESLRELCSRSQYLSTPELAMALGVAYQPEPSLDKTLMDSLAPRCSALPAPSRQRGER